MTQRHKLVGSKAVKPSFPVYHPSQRVNMSLAAAAGTGWRRMSALKQLKQLQSLEMCSKHAQSRRKGARKMWFHADLILILRPQLLKKNSVWKMHGSPGGEHEKQFFSHWWHQFPEWVGRGGANAADAQLRPLPSGHRCRVSPSSISETATFLALKAWNINPAPSVLLFVNKVGLSLLSHRSCGQPDGLISGSLAAFRHKLGGGEGLRSAGRLLPSQGSHKEQAAAGGLHWERVNI